LVFTLGLGLGLGEKVLFTSLIVIMFICSKTVCMHFNCFMCYLQRVAYRPRHFCLSHC